MFCFNHASAFLYEQQHRKIVMNNKFKAKTQTGNATGNLCCHVLTSRALNMSRSFDQSARSIYKAAARSSTHVQLHFIETYIQRIQMFHDLTHNNC